MAGVVGRSGGRRVGAGRRPLPLDHHILRGTFRPSRHGARLAAGVVGATARQVAETPCPAWITAGLREPGLRLVADLWREYGEWAAADQAVLHELGLVVDQLDQYAATLARSGVLIKTAAGQIAPNPLLRLQAAAQRALVLLLGKLNLRTA